jgi:ABC-type branched-subunit amino acid transport system ATPase component
MISSDLDSLVWIAGDYADSIAQERFVESVLNGEVPIPIPDRRSRTLQSRLVYRSPESLIDPPQTVLSACGLVNYLMGAALDSAHCICPECGARLARYRSPLQLLNAITNDWRQRKISIYAQSQHRDLLEWAQLQGLSVTGSLNSTPSVYLSQLVCDEDTIRSIGALIHSIWRVPALYLTVSDSSGEYRSYSSNGWCESCKACAKGVSRAELYGLLTGRNSSSLFASAEALLEHYPFQTVQHLLNQPIRDLKFNPDSPLERARKLLSNIGLKACSFGSKTDALNAADLARLSIASSILASNSPRDHIILDLPCGIFDPTEAQEIRRALVSAGAFRKITTISGPFQHTESEDHSSGELIRLYRGRGDTANLLVFTKIAAAIASRLDKTGESFEFVALPVFQTRPKSAKVIGGELGLLEPLYSASLDARTSGLSARDFTLFGARSPRYVCEQCRGLGVLLIYHEHLSRPVSQPCSGCAGLRCNAPISSALFRGVSFSTVLNQPIERSLGTLASLSKAKSALNLATILDLNHLPLGMPVALLSHSEVRRLAIVKALLKGRVSKPVIIVIEQPDAGLSASQRAAVRQVRDRALLEGSAVWVEVV